METPYTDLRFSHNQLNILREIKIRNTVPRKHIDKKRETKYAFLFKYHLIDYADKTQTTYKLSDKAQMLLRYNFERKYQYWISIALSASALAISIIALCYN